MSKEANVGLLVAILCIVLTALAPTQRTRAPILGVQYKLTFHDTEGLKRGDSVVMGGVPAGRVVAFDYAPREDWAKLNPGQPDVPMVLVTVALDSRFKVPAHSGYKIIANLRGEHFVNIIPGPPTDMLPPGSVVNMELLAEVEDTVGVTVRNMKALAVRTEDMRKQFSDPEFRRDLKDGASNARFYSNEFLGISKKATAQVNDASKEIDNQERRLLEQTQRMDAQVAAAQGYIQKTIPVARQQLREYRAKLSEAQKQMDTMASNADKFTANLQNLAHQLESRRLGQADIDKLRKQVKDVSDKMDVYSQAAGDIHAITSDEEVRANLKGQLGKFKGKSEKLKETVNKYNDMLDSLKWLMKFAPEEKYKDEAGSPKPTETPKTP